MGGDPQPRSGLIVRANVPSGSVAMRYIPSLVSKHEQRDGWELADAARALEYELQRFEELAAAARRLPLDSQRNIAKAAKMTTEAAEGQGRVDIALGALVRSISAVRERHERNATALQTRGEEIRVRAEEYATLFTVYQALGEEGRVVNEMVQAAAGLQVGTGSSESVTALVLALAEIDERMASLIARAKDLARTATTASMTDLAGQADALKQQITAARNKVSLLKRGLEPADPSKLS